MKRLSEGRTIAVFVFAAIFALCLPNSAWAHGFAGQRFFPTTFQVEDPFISDELSLVVNHIKDPEAKSTEVGVDYSKRITPHFGLSVGESYLLRDVEGEGSSNGFGNLELGLKYQFLTSEVHETIMSVGIGAELGGTGASRVGAESFSVISPALYFGKGLGDLPQSLSYLRPFAITGVVGPNFPTKKSSVTVNEDTGEVEEEENLTTLTWAFTVQYSLAYLQSFVKDIGLGDPLKRMVLIAEFPMETCMSGDCKGQTTGTFNPGVVWIGKYMQLGLAAEIPINSRTGNNVGVLALVHLFLDDLFPKSLGRPIFP